MVQLSTSGVSSAGVTEAAAPEAAAPEVVAGVRGRSKVVVWKVLKTGVAVGLLAFGARAAGRYLFIDESYQAAVVATATVVRAPISGYVAESLGAPGKVYAAKETIGQVEARIARDEHLHDAEVQLARVNAQVEALSSVQPQLERLENVLRRSSSVYDAQRVKQLHAEAEQAEALVKAARARKEANDTKLKRAESLLSEGLSTQDALEQARRDAAVSEQEVASADAAKLAIEGVVKAAQSGIQIGSFGADKAYSAQRLDEMTLRLVDWRTQLLVAQAEASSLEKRVSIERREAGVRGRATVAAPVRGRVWQTYVSPQDYVAEGSPLLRLATCALPMVAAAVSESIYNRVRIGQPVTFRLSATREKLAGVVTQTFGVMDTPAMVPFEWPLVPNAEVAFGVTSSRGNRGLVLVQLERWPGGVDCQVGATGDMLFSALPFAKWLW